MARAATAPELALMRSDGQRTKLFLAVLQPKTIYTAQLSSAPSSNDNVAEIGFSSGSGTLGDVKAGMTLYAGSSAGAYDLGMCRIRKAAIAGTFYIGETSEIEWDYSGTVYLTVVDDYDIWERRFKNVTGTLKADYDTAYSDQLSSFAPVAVMGPDAVVWLDDGPVDVYFDEADQSWVPGSTITGYSFASDAGAWTNPTTAGAYLTVSSYPTNGHINVWLTVTAANGKTHTGHRYIHVFDADHPPAEIALKSKPNASYDAGGYTFSVEMYDGAELSELRERSLAVLFSKDWFGGSEQYIGPIVDRENVKFVGRVAGESIKWDADSGSVEFSVHGPQYWMSKIPGFGNTLTPVAGTPAAWGQMANMTVDKALWFLLHWCSTVDSVLDVKLTDDDRYCPEITPAGASLWEQIKDIAGKFVFAVPGCDRYGRLFVEIDPQMTPEADRDWPDVMEIIKDDWAENIDARRTTVDEISQVNMSSWQVGVDTSVLTRYSLAPGHVPEMHGRIEVLDNALAGSQSEANQQAGLLLGWRNKEYEFSIPLAQANFLIDLWPRQFCNIDIAAGDTPRGVAYDGNLIPRAITWNDNEALTPTITFESETFEQLAVNGDIPLGDGTSMEIPDMPPMPKLPPLPPLDNMAVGGLISEEELDIGPGSVLIVTSSGVLYSTNFDESDPDWYLMNNGLTVDQYTTIERIVRTPSGALFALIRDPLYSVGADYVFWAPGLGSSWSLLFDITGLPGTTPRLVALGINPNVDEEIAIVTGSATDDTGAIYTGDRNGVSSLASGLDISTRLGDVSYGMDKWYITHSERNTFSSQAFSRVSAAGSVEKNAVNYALGQTYSASKHHHKRGGGIIYEWNNDMRYLRKISDNDGDASNTTQPNVGVSENTYPNFLAVDPSGQYLMGGHDGAIGKRSSDYGASWGNVDGSLGIGYQVWENCQQTSAWLTGSAQTVKYTPDFGDTWVVKTGNLATIAPLCTMQHILFISW